MNFSQWLNENEVYNCPDWDTLRYKYSVDANGDARLDFFDKTGAVGYLIWSLDDGEVEKIYVGDKCRRKGLGTHMWNTAVEYSKQNNIPEPEHSSRRSYEGEMFAQSIGGYVPRLTDDITGWSGRNS